MRDLWVRHELIHGMLRRLGSFLRCDDTLVDFGIFKYFESECELSLLKNILYLESVPSFIISEENKLKYSMQCFRNVA